MRVVVIGCGVAGLSAGIGLARSGHRVTILERDPAPGTMDIEAAFGGWRRNGVPQIRQGHFILGRAKDMLDRHAPDVIAALAAEGIVPASNPMLMLLSPEELLPGDDLTPIPTRRIPFELTMRRVAEAEDGIDIRSGVKVSGLSVTHEAGLPRVRGVGLADGTSIEADFVVDAGGRRSPVAGWLREHGAALPSELTQDSGVTYYGRYFRAKGAAPDPWELLGSEVQTDYLLCVVFPGDNGTYGVCFCAPRWDRELRALRDVRAWNAAANLFPSVAPWVCEHYADALNPVEVTSGHGNMLRPFLNGGVPAYLGLLPVGDALGTTDALLAWGMSLGMTHGFAAARMITDHAAHPGDAALAYSAEVMGELEACFRVASTGSRVRIRRWKGEYTGPENIDEEHEKLFGELPVAEILADAAIMRAFFRRVNLTDAPDAIFRDAEVVAKMRACAERRGDPSATQSGPSRDELAAVVSREAAAVAASR